MKSFPCSLRFLACLQEDQRDKETRGRRFQLGPFNYINFIVAVEVEFRIKFTIAAVESFADVGAVVKETMRLLSAKG
jgi:hypothetical protein